MLFDLLTREVVLLLALALVGSGIAVRGLPSLALNVRLALAPALGLAATAPGLMVLNFVFPLKHALLWAILPAAAASVVWAARGLRREGSLTVRAGVGAALPAALLSIAVFGVATKPIDDRVSHGPVGWGIFDGPGYITYIQGYRDETNERPLGRTEHAYDRPAFDDVSWGEPWNLGQRYGWNFKFQHTSSMTVPAAVGGVLGWPPWQALTPFLIALLATGALGTYALTASLGGSRVRWWAVAAGLAFAGPVVYQLFSDGSGGLISGLALLPALLTIGVQALRAPSWRTTALFGLMIAGLQACYPEIVVIPLASAGLAVFGLGVHLRRRGRLSREANVTAAKHLALVGALALLLSPRTTVWTINYLKTQLVERSLLGGTIDYNMPLKWLPGWLAQSIDFYDFSLGTPASPDLLLGYVLPGLMAAVAGYALFRTPWAPVLLAFVAIVLAQAIVGGRSYDCPYCTQRTLTTLSPVIPALVVIGLATLWARGTDPVRRLAVVGIAVAAVAAAGTTMSEFLKRVEQGAFMASFDLDTIEDDVKPLKGTLALEGFAFAPYWAWAEQPTTYTAIDQATEQRLSVAAEHNDWGGFSYYRTRPRFSAAYTPDYAYVVSRLGALDSGRGEPVVRRGPLKIERRAVPFDVMPASGFAVDSWRRDRTGVPWVQGPGNQMGFEQTPPTFWISALDRGTAYLRLKLLGPPELTVAKPRPASIRRNLANGEVDVCFPVAGPARQRVINIEVTPPAAPLGPSGNPYDPVPVPGKTVRLLEAKATPQPCPRAQPRRSEARNASAARKASGVPIS